MPRLSNLTRIALSLTLISVAGLLGLRSAGVFDDGHHQLLSARVRLCEQVAVSCSEFVSRGDAKGMGVVLEALALRNPEVLSVAWRNQSGRIAWHRGPHENLWRMSGQNLEKNCLFVPILQGSQEQGRIEMVFKPLVTQGFVGFMALPSVRAICLAALLNFLGFGFCLRKCFQALDPNRVVPQRVRSALDTLAEGVLVLDAHKRIVLANEAMSHALGVTPANLAGQSLASLPWEPGTPWEKTLNGLALEKLDHNVQRSKVRLRSPSGGWKTFLVSATEVFDDEQVSRGLLVSFDDITAIENSTKELEAALFSLRESQTEIQEQNERLHFLATRDPLTSCLNRRSFFEILAKHWDEAKTACRPLACIMTDIDHFKSINDKHGHAMGDEVLRQVSETLSRNSGDDVVVCRYGGEEFCILVPDADIRRATELGETLRRMIEALEISNLKVTSSFGVSDTYQHPNNPEELIDQADKGLYEAKRRGRNCVSRFSGKNASASDPQTQQILQELNSISSELAAANSDETPKDKETKAAVKKARQRR